MKDTINILAIGDIVGKPGRTLVRDLMPALIRNYGIDFIVANGENAAGGAGITSSITMDLLTYGIDVITTGNHVWDNKDVEAIIENEPRLLRPANFPDGVPGNGWIIRESNGFRIAVINLMGRLYLNPIDCPFKKFDSIYSEIKDRADIIIVDLHAEATSEKRAFGWYVAGRATAVFGTHTHVQTADEEILHGGTGYITDAGMTGSFNSVIGMERINATKRFLQFTKVKVDVATGNNKLNGVIFTVKKDIGTEKISRIIIEN